MATGTRICKVCGKEYECCKTLRHVDGVFRWQDVACCVEHGEEYLEKILISRKKGNDSKAEAIESTNEPEVAHQKSKTTKRRRKAIPEE